MRLRHVLFALLLGGLFFVSPSAEAGWLGANPSATEPGASASRQLHEIKKKKNNNNDQGSKHKSKKSVDDDDDGGKGKKEKGDEAELTECTIQQPGGGGGCKVGFKRVCEKMKSGKKCCGCVPDKNAEPPEAKAEDQPCFGHCSLKCGGPTKEVRDACVLACLQSTSCTPHN
jgi:hypothetical protein